MAGQTEIAKMIVTLGMDTSSIEKEASNVEKSVDNLGKSTSKAFSKTGSTAEAAMTKIIAKASIAVSVLKKIGAAVKQFVVDELVKGSFKAAATYEQLSGGAELMFGEAFDFIRGKSLQAFKSAGLSANEYLQQVNGLATGLKTALGGDEMAAAKLADRVITAEADVVAATGNSQEAVQNAFNGIMKSNYMMLDNLQLGIKPTKEGFQELIDKVNAWNAANGKATKYQIDNLADAQAALVDYIEMQGLAGYAARESSTTIEGAMNRMRAAWENVKLAIGGKANLAEAFGDLGESVQIWINNAAPQFANVVANIGRAMVDGVPRVMENIGAAIADNFPKIAAGIGILLLKIVQLVLKGIGKLMQSITNGIAAFGRWLINYDWKGLVSGVWNKISGAIETGWNSLTGKLKTWAGTILQWLENLINEKLNGMINSLIGGLPDFIKDSLGLKGGANIHVDLGSSQLLGDDAKPKAEKEDPTVRELKKVNWSIVQGNKANLNALQWFGTAEDYLQSVIDANGGTEYAVNKQGGNITDAVNGSGTGTGGESDYTLLDVIKDDRQRWYETYTIGGNYDTDLLKEIQGHVDLLQSKGIYISNADVLGDTIPPEIKDALKTVSAAQVLTGWQPTDFTQVGEQIPDDLATNDTVNGVTSAVNGKEYSPTINAPDVNTDPIVSAIQGISITVNTTVAAMDPSGIITAIQGITVDVHADIPQAEVTVNTDTSSIDTSAANLDASATALGDTGAAGALTTAAENFIPSDNPFMPNNPQDAMAMIDTITSNPNGLIPGVLGAVTWNMMQQSDPVENNMLQPIPEEVIVSYQSFATAIRDIVTALNGGEGEEGATMGLTAALGGIPDLFSNILNAAQPLAGFFGGGMVAGIKTLMQHLCQASVDEEGNASGAGGNTLYTALGLVFTLFEDTLATSQLLAQYWTGGFISASEKMRTEAGLARGVIEGLGGAAQGTAAQFFELTNQIYNAVDAYLALFRVKGTGKGGGNGKSVIDAKASGGPVRGGSTYLVGEHGPEIFTPNRSGYIIPNEDLRASGDQGIRIEVNGNIYGESYLKDYVVKLMTGQIRKELRLAQ